MHDPRPDLEKLRIPVLALSGELDLQVDPVRNLAAVRAAFERGGNADHQIVLLPGINHFLQPAETGLPSEYPEIGVAYAPEVLDHITEWIRDRFGEPREDA